MPLHYTHSIHLEYRNGSLETNIMILNEYHSNSLF